MKRFMIILASTAVLAACGRSYKCTLPHGEPSTELQSGVETVLDSIKASVTMPVDYMNAVNLHSLLVIKDDNIVAEHYFETWPAEKPHAMFSVSKTFTATAVGLAISEGRLSLTDKVADYFPDKILESNPCTATVEDLLTMSCGHDTDPSAGVVEFDMENVEVHIKDDADDISEVFFSHPFVHEPGTFYCYNSLCSYILSAIITKVTGESIRDYLITRLFEPLGMGIPEWDADKDGISAGGWGLRLVPEQMARMGLLLLHEGRWEGKQIVPAEWVRAMGAKHVESTPANTRMEDSEKISGRPDTENDWRQGYGYQTWRNVPGGFRADGAGGQFILVLPEKNAVVVMTAWLINAQRQLDLIWEHIYPNL